jgi:hypothetical protein
MGIITAFPVPARMNAIMIVKVNVGARLAKRPMVIFYQVNEYKTVS